MATCNDISFTLTHGCSIGWCPLNGEEMKFACIGCHKELEVNYRIDSKEGAKVPFILLHIECPKCGTRNEQRIQPIMITKNGAKKEEPKVPNYIG